MKPPVLVPDSRNRAHFGGKYGFTLIELLVVISIIGLISSIALAALNVAREKALVASAIAFERHSYASLYDNLVAGWEFDDVLGVGTSAPDISGNGNTLSWFGTAASLDASTPTGSGKSLLIPVGESASTLLPLKNPPTTSFTVSFWVNFTTTTGFAIISNAARFPKAVDPGPSTAGTWSFYRTDDTSLGYFSFWSSLYTTYTINNFTAGKWIHIAGVCDAATNKIVVYVNGNKGTPVPLASGNCVYSNSGKIFLDTPVADSYSGFRVDNVRIFSKAMPISMVEKLYLAEKPKFDKLASAQK